ncbi:hypothetical protein F0U60_31740 [Archangium minus]|uniref:STAS/SEC14 domain-containing protein n=1 Tax=Archangium minus TaxID=83450 RepID=A0ABY9WYI3_9BACT|nr:hypothetical protein F0U60_31740 [Archangium minus]
MGPPTSSLVDDSLWPLVRVTLPRVMTNEQQKELLERILFYLRREERFVTLVDARQLWSVSAELREQQWRFLRQHDVLIRQGSMGIVVLINSPAVALMIRVLVHRIQPKVVPYSIQASWPAAVSWVAERLDGNGLREHARRVRQSLGSSPDGRTWAEPLGVQQGVGTGRLPPERRPKC